MQDDLKNSSPPCFRGFGLSLASDITLSEFKSVPCSDVDVRVHVQPLSSPMNREGLPRFGTVGDPDRLQYRLRDIGDFKVFEGQSVQVRTLPDVEPSMYRLPFLGFVTGALLYQRGAQVLHGSAVAVQGEAVAFVGSKGTGKSTMAAAMVDSGYQLVADDIVALTPQTSCLHVIKSPPFLKLWPDALDAFISAFDSDTPLYTGATKRIARATSYSNKPTVPLKRIYLLAQAPETGVEHVGAKQALPDLLRHSFAARFLCDDMSSTARSFQACSQIAELVPVRVLYRRPRLDYMNASIRAVEKDLGVA
jgi:hypothetical protein